MSFDPFIITFPEVEPEVEPEFDIESIEVTLSTEPLIAGEGFFIKACVRGKEHYAVGIFGDGTIKVYKDGVADYSITFAEAFGL